MDIFSSQIVAAIKKIRTQKGKPDSDKIFKEIIKESTTNFPLEDIQQALQHMVTDGKLISHTKVWILIMLQTLSQQRLLVTKISIFRRILLQMTPIPSLL